MRISRSSKGFTLIELLVVISIISLLSSVVLASLNSARAKARDTRRLSDMHQMQIALDMYLSQFGRYPDSDYSGPSGWDTNANGTFITPLVANNFLTAHLSDTINPASGNYYYYRYPPGYMGCDPARGGFYVLMIGTMERITPTSPGWSCPSQNWTPFATWVTGKFEQ